MKHTQNNTGRGGDAGRSPVVQGQQRRSAHAGESPKNVQYARRHVQRNLQGGQTVRRQPQKSRQLQPPRVATHKKRKKISFTRAAVLLAAENIQGFRIKLSITLEDVVRAVISGILIIFFTMLQATVFVQFPIFGAVPDLMLALTVALAISEGERHGAVCGLISAVIIESLGGIGMTLLPLLYVPVGFFCGVLAKNYFSDSIPTRAAFIAVAALGRSVVSFICASAILNATLIEIAWNIVVPEYFATVILSPLVFAAVWISMKNFHKTRAEKTGKIRD